MTQAASPFVADTDRPELQTIELRIPSADLTLHNFVTYQYDSHFLTPADGWSFTIEDDNRIDVVRRAVVPGALCTLAINGHVQASGLIDSVDIQNSRDSGTTMVVQGRDRLGQVVDATADPTLRFPSGQPLDQILTQLMAPFGLGTFTDDNAANRSVITGSKYGTRTSKKGKPLKKILSHQLQPYPKEGCFSFCARICQRLGLWLWLAADGETVIIGTPDFDMPAKFHLTRRTDGSGVDNNVLSGGIKYDFAEQPDIVMAEGFSGGQQWGHSRIRARALNPLTTVDAGGLTVQSVQDFLAKFNDPDVVSWPDLPRDLRVLKRENLGTKAPPVRLMYLHDDESHTPEELQAFVQREMSLKLRRAVAASYTVEGHTQNGLPWCVDSIVDVQDDIAGFHGPLWVMSRSLHKDRSGGTRTHLELILPNTLVF